MRLFSRLVVAPLVLVTALSSPAFAQDRHVVSPSALAAVIDHHIADQDADRAVIHSALNRPEVRNMAAKAGVNLEQVAASIDGLTGADLQRAALAARHVNQALVGGANTVVISTTTVIIGLLVLLLIVVAVD